MMIDDVLLQMKIEYEKAITTASFNNKTYLNGAKAKEALIRSQKLIYMLHDLIKNEFIQMGVVPNLIYPDINGTNQYEITLCGKLKNKVQDICIIPTNVSSTYLVHHKKHYLLEKNKLVNNVISINVRSQLSSMAKNIDTLYERTFAEALNIHLEYPEQCLGEVYLIPTHEYDDKSMKYNTVKFKKQSNIEQYIEMFQNINLRNFEQSDEYKYERVCLLIVDFRQEQPKLYSTIEELKADGLISRDSCVNMEGLSFPTFARDLLSTYQNRLGNICSIIKV